MKNPNREIHTFFFSQHFADGLRITLAVLLPALILGRFQHFAAGLTISVGALCVSVTDAPGPVAHKRNAMIYCCLLVFVTALLTGFARMNPYTMGLTILAFSFIFSMFNVYGMRVSAIGTACLLIMVLTMDQPMNPAQVLHAGLLTLAGGIWYTALAMVLFTIRPYRQAQRALGECIRETAAFLRIRAGFYSRETDLEEGYRKLVAQQIIVTEKQDAVRELLFKTRQIVKESTPTGRLLVLTFVDVVDLFEEITASYYDYSSLRERFTGSSILEEISALAIRFSDELDAIGLAIHANQPLRKTENMEETIESLRQRIDMLAAKDSGTLVLKKILVNIRKLSQRIRNIQTYFNVPPDKRPDTMAGLDYNRFISTQAYDLKIFRNNLSLRSATFRHSVRMAAACFIGYIGSQLIAYGHHSYWILLTIIVILKPGFSLTRQRNFQRLLGTLVGGLIGVGILSLVHDKTVLFFIMLFFMLGSYSFQRINYIVMVILMTPYVLILFRFFGLGVLSIVEERVLDTLIGGLIAFLVSYLLFPIWESAQIRSLMQATLRANLQYLQKVADSLAGRPVSIEEYKLARKDVYVSSANLSAAFQRMLSEPRNKQHNSKEVFKFAVLNHILSSNIATLTAVVQPKEQHSHSVEVVRPLRRTLAVLADSLKKFNPGHQEAAAEIPALPSEGAAKTSQAEDPTLIEQLEFIHRLSQDISRTTDTVLAKS